MEIIGFILVSIGLIIVPGPNVLAIVSASISYGKVRGLQTVAGTSAAMLLQLSIAALGTNLLVKNLVTGFFWLKWLGVSYLIYLGINHLLRFGEPKASPISAIESFQRGFWISLTNPKTILFFCAFFPQFTDSSASYLIQIAEL